MSLNPLNPAAGDVPIPEDQREVDAALRAGPITLRIFPYLDWRYGERGRKFTASDSAWLAWLVRHDQTRVNEQILWLRSVLSNRGMPGWILEIHLRSLHKQLVRSIPEKRAAYHKLAAAAQLLGGQRREILSDEVWTKLALGFASAIGAPNRITKGVGRMLVASVIDERLGVKNAVRSVESWLSGIDSLRRVEGLRRILSSSQCQTLDSDRFAARWHESMTATIAIARKSSRG